MTNQSSFNRSPFIKLQDVKPDSQGISLVLKVASIVYTADHGEKKFTVLKVGDDTASIDLFLEGQDFREGVTLVLRNVIVMMVKGLIRLELGKWSKISEAKVPAGFSVNRLVDLSAVAYEEVYGQ